MKYIGGSTRCSSHIIFILVPHKGLFIFIVLLAPFYCVETSTIWLQTEWTKFYFRKNSNSIWCKGNFLKSDLNTQNLFLSLSNTHTHTHTFRVFSFGYSRNLHRHNFSMSWVTLIQVLSAHLKTGLGHFYNTGLVSNHIFGDH